LCPFFLAGCAKPNHEKAIRERAQTLIGALCRGDNNACLQFADPLFVRAQGENNVKGRFGILAFFIKVGKLSEADIRIDEVGVSPDGKNAVVRISYLSQGQWKVADPINWVFSEGKWYVKLA
jgi:hypothetical protein